MFPRLDVTAAIESYARVTDVFLDSLGQIMVDLRHDVGWNVAPELQGSATSHYTLDSQFRVTGAELGQRVPLIHSLFERKGLLDHPFSPEYDARFLWPVRRWDGAKFAEISGPQTRGRR